MTNISHIGPYELDWTAGHLAGWTYHGEIKKWFQGTFRNLHSLVRACPTCNGVIKIDVTSQALTGHATNHGLALRRCKKCREALKTGGIEYEVRKRLGDVTPPPVAAVESETVGFAPPPAADREELDRLRKWEPTMFAVLRKLQSVMPATTMLNMEEAVGLLVDGGNKLNAHAQELRAEIADLRAKLAAYDLPAALAAMPWQK